MVGIEKLHTSGESAGPARCEPNGPWEQVIGIVGGLGPFAHLELERLLLSAAADLFDRPLKDQDYPPWILSSIPATPDRTAAIAGEVSSPVPALLRSLEILAGTEAAPGADFAVIACNTAHLYVEEVRQRVRIPILDMVAETLHTACDSVGEGGRVGLLATTGTLKARVYEKTLERIGRKLDIVSPLNLGQDSRGSELLQEELVMRPIFGEMRAGQRTGGGIKSGAFQRGKDSERLAQPLHHAAMRLIEAGAELLISACTEIPLVLGRSPISGVPQLDSLDVAAKAAISIAAAQRALPPASANRQG